ncbi:MAG: M48 family metallopeptidase [Paracoccaceae bacterium]
MAKLVLAGDPAVDVIVRRNARARRLSLRVSRFDGSVTLSLPRWSLRFEAMEFAREKEGWIRRQLARKTDEILPRIGGQVMFEGVPVEVAATRSRAAHYSDGKILVPGDLERVAVRVAAFLKAMARQRLTVACDHHAALLGLDYGRITLRDTRSRWGSCTTQGNLMFSWRLVMAPVPVLQYVAAHEVAHLVQMNHSPAYWDVVERLCPGYGEPRKWLRQNGHRLHAYRFGN